ncbi:potassium-transporting ATPase subunit KdpA, partial [Paenibacillus durus]
GSLSGKKSVAAGEGTLSTSSAMFAFLLIAIILLIGALSFLPALALGPIADYFTNRGLS